MILATMFFCLVYGEHASDAFSDLGIIDLKEQWSPVYSLPAFRLQREPAL